MSTTHFNVIILLGKSGSGKGTQADLLEKKFKYHLLSSGHILRKRAKKLDFIGEKIKKLLAMGGLIPTPIVFHLWLHDIESLRKKHNISGVVLEGSPRKLYEAYLLQEVLQFYGWDKNLRVFEIKISDKEALRRLLSRKRHDDQTQAIKNRLKWFQDEVRPAISFYKKLGALVSINGEQSPERVFEDILKNLRFYK